MEPPQQGAGLKMAAHPLLLDQTPAVPQSKKDRYKPMQPKFASIRANVRNQPSPSPAPVPIATPSPAANPYSAASNNATKDGIGFEGAPRERAGKKFHFNPKGKYIAMADQMRQEQQLEALKQRIAAGARKAGLDGDIGIEKAVKVCNISLLKVKSSLNKSPFSVHLLLTWSGGMLVSCRTNGTAILLFSASQISVLGKKDHLSITSFFILFLFPHLTKRIKSS